MAKRDISAPGALPHNRLEWSSAKRQRADDNTKRKEQIMNEANNLPEDQELSWILEEYRDWPKKTSMNLWWCPKMYAASNKSVVDIEKIRWQMP